MGGSFVATASGSEACHAGRRAGCARMRASLRSETSWEEFEQLSVGIKGMLQAAAGRQQAGARKTKGHCKGCACSQQRTMFARHPNRKTAGSSPSAAHPKERRESTPVICAEDAAAAVSMCRTRARSRRGAETARSAAWGDPDV